MAPIFRGHSRFTRKRYGASSLGARPTDAGVRCHHFRYVAALETARSAALLLRPKTMVEMARSDGKAQMSARRDAGFRPQWCRYAEAKMEVKPREWAQAEMAHAMARKKCAGEARRRMQVVALPPEQPARRSKDSSERPAKA